MMTDIDESEVTNFQSQTEQDSEDEGAAVDFSEASKKLAEGLLTIYQLPLEQVKKELNELTTKQDVLLTEMQAENTRLREALRNGEINDLYQTAKLYQGKLTSMKKEMTSIHERTFRLKKRALRLQQLKQREAYQREQQREQEIRREQDLIGKPSAN